MADIIETVSENRISAQDVESLAEELEAYQAMYDSFFSRIEQRRQAKAYLQGLMQPLPNKSIERIVLHNQGDDANAIRAMQNFMSDSPWQDEPILQRHWQEVDQGLGAEDGVLDEAFGRNSDFSYVWYLAEVPSDTTAWLKRPATAVPAWSGQGRKPVREQLVEG